MKLTDEPKQTKFKLTFRVIMNDNTPRVVTTTVTSISAASAIPKARVKLAQQYSNPGIRQFHLQSVHNLGI